MSQLKGLGKKSREQLSLVLKRAGEIITVPAAAQALKLPEPKVAQLLGSWCRHGWLSRIKRGVYAAVPLASNTSDIMVDEPWALASLLFSRCYIGGWSAAEHWDLTEQIFNSVLVITERKVHERNLKLNGATFQLKTVTPERMFGTQSVWIKNKKVEVSDPSRTIIDLFNDPALGGGIRSTTEIYRSYLNSKHRDSKKLIEYADKNHNSATMKRMGYVTEQIAPHEDEIIKDCQKRIKSGLSKLDPDIAAKRLITRWGLWVPRGFEKGILT